ncbi:MAG: murein biosynthesis integral membrane protein MurJ, partial [Alphaproteobacteria bacterium]
FAAAAATPILLNLVLIGSLLGAAPHMTTPGHALAWGVAVAGIVQFLWLIGACRRAGMIFRLPRPRLTPDVRRLLRLMLPGAIGAGVVQINLLIDIVIASLLPTGAISFLYYADRVNQLPLGVVGVAVGTALLPLLSRQLRDGDADAANASMNRALEFSLLLSIPAAAALMVIAEPVVVVLFQRGVFDAASAAASAHALIAYAAGLPAYILIKVYGPGFFAREDTTTPVRIAVFCVAVNLALNLILIQFIAHVGIALATAISAWINAGLLGFILRRRGHYSADRRLRQRLPRMVLAALVMAAGLYAARHGLEAALAGPASIRIAALAALVIGGMALYGASAIVFRAAAFSDIRALMARRA